MSQTGIDTEKDLTASVERAKKEISHKNGSDKEIRSIRLLYIISAVLLSPISGFIADLFRIGNRYMILLTSLRCFFVQYIIFAILTLWYIFVLKTEDPPESEFPLFVILIIAHVIGFAWLELMVTAAMGI